MNLEFPSYYIFLLYNFFFFLIGNNTYILIEKKVQ